MNASSAQEYSFLVSGYRSVETAAYNQGGIIF